MTHADDPWNRYNEDHVEHNVHLFRKCPPQMFRVDVWKFSATAPPTISGVKHSAPNHHLLSLGTHAPSCFNVRPWLIEEAICRSVERVQTSFPPGSRTLPSASKQSPCEETHTRPQTAQHRWRQATPLRFCWKKERWRKTNDAFHAAATPCTTRPVFSEIASRTR